MPISKKPPRYGHSEGHTDICYDHSGGNILTCGSDGDIRIWKGFEDDDPETINVGDRAYAIATKNDSFVTASDNNTVQARTFPDGAPNGIVARFTAPVNHIQFNKSGTKLLSGASDFSVKLVTIEDNTQLVFEGHSAPVLSVSCDPKEEYIATSSCDGTVKIWSIEDQSWEKSMSVLPKCSDFSISKTLCRLSWEPNEGKNLCIPVEKEIQLIERDTWDLSFSLTNDSVTSTVSIATFSPCGNFIAGACVDGTIFVWDVESRECLESIKNNKGVGICGVAWNPKKTTQIAYTDISGQLGFLENVIPEEHQKKAPAKIDTNQYADLFDGDDNDDALLKAATQYDEKGMASGNDDADDDDDDILKHHRKSNFNGIPDDESLDGILGNSTEVASKVEEPAKPQVIYEAPKVTPLQKPFISAATPVHLTCRFMKWNNIGIIRSYDGEDESSIDVEFHDSSVHHALHIDNQLNYTMADLSAQAVLLANEKDDDGNLSQLTCLHFGSWDTQKEWNTSMPKGEEIKSLCLGWNWLAVGTDKRLVRIFSIGGVQHGMFAIPGPIVSMSGYGNQLMVVYHMGTGVPGDQCLGVKLLHLSGKRRQIITAEMLPITPKSTLTWLGFSEEGTPVTADSEGVVRMLSREIMSWVPIVNTKATAKSRSDHYWIVGVNEEQGQLRCIQCKGSTFPPTLPRPSAIVLPFQIAVCEIETEKSLLEEKLLKTNLFSEHHKYAESQGYEVNELDQSEGVRDKQQVLMKMFALACKSDREYRAVEICEKMVSEHELSLAIKYASRLRRIKLAQKLSELAKRRMEEEMMEEEEWDEEDTQNPNDCINRKNDHHWKSDTQTSNYVEDEEMEDNQGGVESDTEETQQKTTPVLKLKPKDNIPKSMMPSSQERRNPFKSSAKKTQSGNARGTSVFDDVSGNKPSKNGKGKNTSDTDLISPPKSAKKKGQTTLLSMKSKSSGEKTTTVTEKASDKKPTTAFGLWMEENNEQLKEKHPNISEADITKVAMTTWRALNSEQRKEWTEKFKAQSSLNTAEKDKNTENRKRKLTEPNETGAKRSNVEKDKAQKTNDVQGGSQPKKPLSSATNSKLQNFMFSKT
ncbi:WD repeat and HMG-box DNA-binding protein 1-like [Anneissia japonica]|uniref:WD repeat and HMG-box DNA-binding protein 1-like n=1 Tax=Anneissia japonica TaxID=1529436 RepID=UPI0014258DF4|nr:WD repeat and HMG-box DNA-binding protein 1-like [Anneissia japonica]